MPGYFTLILGYKDPPTPLPIVVRSHVHNSNVVIILTPQNGGFIWYISNSQSWSVGIDVAHADVLYLIP